MATSVSITAITPNAGRYLVTLSSGDVMEFSGTAAQVAAGIQTTIRANDPTWIAMLGIAKWLAVNPTGANPGQLVGKTATLDLTATNILTIA